MRILGIDPGLNTTGYGIIDSKPLKLIEAGVIRTESRTPIQSRLKKIYSSLSDIIEEFKPDVLVLEKIYSHYKHPTTAILMGHARGAICLLAKQAGAELVGYSATRVKKAVTGAGHAGKYQMQRMIQNIFNMKSVPNPPDISDALALAVAHAQICQKHGIAGIR